MLNSARVLVVDDRHEDGVAIVESLWHDTIAALFFRFDEPGLARIANSQKRLDGIRVVFQDILLIPGKGSPNHQDFSAALSALDGLLHENNGPWLMVAWSTWAEDPESGQKHADALFAYLSERLPVGKRPYSYIVIDKKPFTTDKSHGRVKEDGELEDSERSELLSEVRKAFARTPALNAIARWESEVGGCASQVVAHLWRSVAQSIREGAQDGVDGLDRRLATALHQLARAQDAHLGKDSNLAPALYEILTLLLADWSGKLSPREIVLQEAEKEFSCPPEPFDTMLHWDGILRESEQSVPGTVFQYPASDLEGICRLPVGDRMEFIKREFLPEGKRARADASLLEAAELVMLDITPPCDHAQKKATWRRYLVGLKVAISHCGLMTAGGRYAHDGVFGTPVFAAGEESFKFFFNSRLVLSQADDQKVLKRLVKVGRIREQLLREVANWYGRMATRPGIVTIQAVKD